MKTKVTNRSMILSWLAVLSWMVIIFCISDQPAVASNNLSTGIIDQLFMIFKIDKVAYALLYNTLNFIIRKQAHLFVYVVLGVLSIRAFLTVDITMVKAKALAIALGIAFALSDEFHQLFVTGRSGQLTDVLIDSIGVICGVLIYCYLFKRKRQKDNA